MPRLIGNVRLTDDRTLAQVKQDALAALADKRWQAAQSFIYDGVEVETDEALTAAVAKLAIADSSILAPAFKYKLADGEFRTWTYLQLKTFATAVSNHVQACFDVEAAATATILAAATNTPTKVIQAVTNALFPS